MLKIVQSTKQYRGEMIFPGYLLNSSNTKWIKAKLKRNKFSKQNVYAGPLPKSKIASALYQNVNRNSKYNYKRSL